MRTTLAFTTDLFLSEQSDEDHDRWFLGGDCAGWFYARLLPVKGVRDFCCPVMEDWGWYFAVMVDQVRVEVATYTWSDRVWMLYVQSRQRLLRKHSLADLERARDLVCNALEEVVRNDPRFLKFKWFSEEPNRIDMNQL